MDNRYMRICMKMHYTDQVILTKIKNFTKVIVDILY